ncbi:MAG: hypothetical protein M5R36_25620 [Deltaproteobacteria bacterium]|nr:hypothetical protein [Deltaproteobacteria bacterium]
MSYKLRFLVIVFCLGSVCPVWTGCVSDDDDSSSTADDDSGPQDDDSSSDDDSSIESPDDDDDSHDVAVPTRHRAAANPLPRMTAPVSSSPKPAMTEIPEPWPSR